MNQEEGEYFDFRKRRLTCGLKGIFMGSYIITNTEKSLKFFSALLRMGKRALHCAGHRDILEWITSGDPKTFIKNIDSGRMCVKREQRLNRWTPEGTILENKVTNSIKSFGQFHIPVCLRPQVWIWLPFTIIHKNVMKADSPLCLGWCSKTHCKEQSHLWLDSHTYCCSSRQSVPGVLPTFCDCKAETFLF